MTKKFLSNHEISRACGELAVSIMKSTTGQIKLYGVPRGGIPIAYLVLGAIVDIDHLSDIILVEEAKDATVIVDDLIDSGETSDHYKKHFPQALFFAAFTKVEHSEWLVFPWEVTKDGGDESATDIITRLLEYTGDNAKREGLLETPKRVLKAWDHWTSGYNKDIPSLLKVFTDGAEGYDEMVIVKDIPIYSKCEHHMADIFGTATIAYIPNGKIVGLSKLSRLADAFARRLQVQERLTNQIAESLLEHLEPLGVGVIIKARHMCMESRGLCQQGHFTITSALRGVIKENRDTRNEFMLLANSPK